MIYNLIIVFLTAISAIMQYFAMRNSKTKGEFKSFFIEYDDLKKKLLVEKSEWTWKAAFYITFLTVLVYFSVDVYKWHNVGFEFDISCLVIIIVLQPAGIIKDIFWNWINFKPKFRLLIMKYFSNSKDFFCVLAIISGLLGSIEIALGIAISTKGQMTMLIAVILSLIWLETIFCISRIVANASFLYYAHEVTKVSIYLSDGTVHSDINCFHEEGSNILVNDQDNVNLYLSKRNITQIKKERDEKPIVDVILERTKKE